MTDNQDTPAGDVKQQVAQTILEAVIPAVAGIKDSGNEEALGSVGPTLIVVAAAMLMGQVGKEGAAGVFEVFAQRIRDGEYDDLSQKLNL